MKINQLLFALVFSVAFFSTRGQTNSSFFDQVEGDWVGSGNLFGTPATFTMTWEKVLSDQFIHLQFSNSFKDQSGTTRTMESKAFYKLGADKNSGHWFDSRGVMFGLEYNLKENELTVFWGDPEKEEGKTEYRLIEGDRIEVKDYVKRNGTFSQFGEAVYTKK
ncbi:hypothetical protein BFP97_18380 [Roseivirga sp. 4D4]|uniref:hypothetical protein n=1 Tax=Roseivirga sp. 4D4 TaxID=1889784 RepID=UPI000852E558|nr:hypothetical protein [Roseivirga sp. 4D4]OEK03369.1 hypothetical protein BFP97_18380 [Roseivirga sp. 4D4]